MIGYRHIFKIGERYKNNAGCWYEIIEYPDDARRRKIKFDSGYECISYVSQLKNGKVRDLLERTYYGVACVGMKDGTSHPLYWRWFNMIGRCYDKNHCAYKSYGAKGVRVSDELLVFKNYIDIVSKLDNYENLIKHPSDWQIDKDSNCKNNNKIYSKDTLKIVPIEENLEIENSQKRIIVDMYRIEDEKLMATFPSISMAEEVTGIPKGNIARVINGKANTAGGYIWREHNETLLY